MECYAGKPNCIIDEATSIVVDLSASSKYSPQCFILELSYLVLCSSFIVRKTKSNNNNNNNNKPYAASTFHNGYFLSRLDSPKRTWALLSGLRDHTYHALGGTPLDEWSAHHRDLYLTTQNTHETDIHATEGIRTRNPSKLAAAGIGRSGLHPKQITWNIRAPFIPCIMICYNCGNVKLGTALHSMYYFFFKKIPLFYM